MPGLNYGSTNSKCFIWGVVRGQRTTFLSLTCTELDREIRSGNEEKYCQSAAFTATSCPSLVVFTA